MYPDTAAYRNLVNKMQSTRFVVVDRDPSMGTVLVLVDEPTEPSCGSSGNNQTAMIASITEGDQHAR